MSAGQAWPTSDGVYQPAWIAYAEAHGRTPDDQHDHDSRSGTFNGSGFICWMSEQRRKWEAETGETLTPSTWDRFHAWLGTT